MSNLKPSNISDFYFPKSGVNSSTHFSTINPANKSSITNNGTAEISNSGQNNDNFWLYAVGALLLGVGVAALIVHFNDRHNLKIKKREDDY